MTIFNTAANYKTLTKKIDSFTQQKTKLEAQLAEIDSDFKNAEKKISLAGLSPALGKILREQRRNLLSYVQLTLETEAIQEESALSSLAQFKVEDRLKALTDVDGEINRLLASRNYDQTPPEQYKQLEAELRELLTTQKELLNKLNLADTSYLRTLADFDFARQQLNTLANKFLVYLDQRLFMGA
ncbi:hypothetical protein [Methylocucumis oryzae]|uniref:hypothetical protein n=1 Tax=Methylocucumis oryzae TaxID=1632867 RepID=UPI0006986659|nr:hypothetical protein [Methylocucumis oryzae]